MKISTFRAVAPNLEKVPHSSDFFDTVKFRYHEYAAEGLFLPAEPDAIYIYQIKNAEGIKSTGLVVATDIEEYFNGSMKPHENTIESSEDTQTELLKMRGAAIKPVLLTYPPIEELNTLIANYLEKNKKFFVIELGNEKHRFWKITEGGTLDKIRQIFAEKIPHAYIADGHHRSASYATLYKSNPTSKKGQILTAYFPDDDIKIQAFHRVVQDLNGLSVDAFLEEIKKDFKIKVLKEGELPYTKFNMTLLVDGQWFQLMWRKDALKQFGDDSMLLDVHLLNEKILKPLLGINDIRTDTRLKYIEPEDGIAKVTEAVGTEGVGFCLFPIDLEDLIAVMDRGEKLPPKSTFFEPRLRNGLLNYEI